MSLPEYLDRHAFSTHTPSSGQVSVSNNGLIAMWAQQLGAAHEDPEINEELHEVLNCGIDVSGLPIASKKLSGISKTVLWVGEEFFKALDSKQ